MSGMRCEAASGHGIAGNVRALAPSPSTALAASAYCSATSSVWGPPLELSCRSLAHMRRLIRSMLSIVKLAQGRPHGVDGIAMAVPRAGFREPGTALHAQSGAVVPAERRE